VEWIDVVRVTGCSGGRRQPWCVNGQNSTRKTPAGAKPGGSLRGTRNEALGSVGVEAD
jgi:hypothetical protein